MPHGDLSDYAAYTCFFSGLVSVLYPSTWFLSAGPLKPFFDGSPTAEVLALIRVIGGLLLLNFPIFFVVRWNTLNGKAAMLGCFVAAFTFAYVGLSLDGNAVVLRPWYLLSAAFVAFGLHFGFNANPMLTSAMLLEKEKKKAEKKAAQGKKA